jgi:hypothetical protein
MGSAEARRRRDKRSEAREEDTISDVQVVGCASFGITDLSLLRVGPEFASPLNFGGFPSHQCAHTTTIVTELTHPLRVEAM